MGSDIILFCDEAIQIRNAALCLELFVRTEAIEKRSVPGLCLRANPNRSRPERDIGDWPHFWIEAIVETSRPSTNHNTGIDITLTLIFIVPMAF